MDADLGIRVHRNEDIPVVVLSGDVDDYTCKRLSDTITGLMAAGDSSFVIGMAGVRYIDSSGLGTLVGGLRRANELNGGLAISSASRQIRKVLDITGLARVLSVFDDEQTAVRSLCPRTANKKNKTGKTRPNRRKSIGLADMPDN